MAYLLNDINFKTVADPCALIEEGDEIRIGRVCFDCR